MLCECCRTKVHIRLISWIHYRLIFSDMGLPRWIRGRAGMRLNVCGFSALCDRRTPHTSSLFQTLLSRDTLAELGAPPAPNLSRPTHTCPGHNPPRPQRAACFLIKAASIFFPGSWDFAQRIETAEPRGYFNFPPSWDVTAVGAALLRRGRAPAFEKLAPFPVLYNEELCPFKDYRHGISALRDLKPLDISPSPRKELRGQEALVFRLHSHRRVTAQTQPPCLQDVRCANMAASRASRRRRRGHMTS